MSLQGTVKNFNTQKGFGFITTPDGKDIFMHQDGCNTNEIGGWPVQGDQVIFDLEESKVKPGQMQATNVTGGTGAPPKKGGGEHQGQCKSVNTEKGFGFIVQADGTDIFFHLQGVSDGSHPEHGDHLTYDIGESTMKPGSLQAHNVTGGTGVKGKGKYKGKGKDWDVLGKGNGGKGGKDFGKGWDSGYGAAKGGAGWGGDDGWGASPYEGGKGKDGGKGGKDGGKAGKMAAMMQMMESMWGSGGDSWGAGGDSWSAPSKGGGKGW